MEIKNINTTPNAEAKAPATATTPTTIAATAEVKTPATTTAATTAPATAPASTPAPEQIAATTPPAPAMTTATTPAPATTAAATTALATDSAARLLDNYLKTGYFQGEGKGRYPDPALVGQAEAIGKALAESNTPPTALNRMVRTLKTAARLPYPAKQGALKKLTPQVLDLENKKKAPPLLREVVERNQRAVQNEADYTACLDHFKDISIFLASEQE